MSAKSSDPADLSSFSLQEPKDRLRQLVAQAVGDRPFSELSEVSFHHDGSLLAGHVLLDCLEEAGYSLDDFDAVGALTAAAVPLATAMIQAAGSRGQRLDGFVLDFVFPGIKGPSVEGKRVILLDAWLSEKSYIQTSSLVTLKGAADGGSELSLDVGVLRRLGAQIVAIAALVGGARSATAEARAETKTEAESGQRSAQTTAEAGQSALPRITLSDPVDGSRLSLPFVAVFRQEEVTAPADPQTASEQA